MSEYTPTDAELDYLVREWSIPRKEAETLSTSMEARYDDE